MILNSPLDAVSNSIAAATFRDLPHIQYDAKDWVASKVAGKDIITKKCRRPMPYEVEVTMFAQTWGSTALGYGGIGGSAMTPAYTVIVEYYPNVCVYFGSGGQLAYSLNLNKLTQSQLDNYRRALNNRNMPDRRGAKIFFGLDNLDA